ncbi:hypothetical protein DSO57_1035958 [Entomophthora muscae]|uniref:Uncharacterized protein n=1 Tax=Entomophthora muscae TaxID=34485 RepID=A0ACC2SCF7_9FUNG|nr:hypothetical protein DSO57_1035958 [Entomophthora muscae]
MNESFSPLIVKIQELSTQIADVCATAAVQEIQIDNVLQVYIALETMGFCKQPLSLPWKRFTPEIHVLNSNFQDSSSGFSNTSVDPIYKLPFKQVFYTKNSTIAAFLTNYKTTIYQAPENLKKGTYPDISPIYVPKSGGSWTN